MGHPAPGQSEACSACVGDGAGNSGFLTRALRVFGMTMSFWGVVWRRRPGRGAAQYFWAAWTAEGGCPHMACGGARGS